MQTCAYRTAGNKLATVAMHYDARWLAPESLQQCMPCLTEGELQAMWHRGSSKLKARLKSKEGLLQVHSTVTLQEGSSKNGFHSCWKQNVFDALHQICLQEQIPIKYLALPCQKACIAVHYDCMAS